MVPSAVMLQFMITSSTPPTRCRGLGLMAVRWLRSRRAWVTASGGALAPGRRRSSPCHGLRPSSTGPVAMSQSRAPYHASGRGPSSSRPWLPMARPRNAAGPGPAKWTFRDQLGVTVSDRCQCSAGPGPAWGPTTYLAWCAQWACDPAGAYITCYVQCYMTHDLKVHTTADYVTITITRLYSL